MRGAVATAKPPRRGGGCRAAGHSNAAGAPRHSKAATTFMRSVLMSLAAERLLAVYVTRGDKEAA
jgi:hypothetical protein